MNKRLVLLLILGVLMYFTNPSQKTHITEAKKALKSAAEKSVSNNNNALVSTFGTAFANELIDQYSGFIITRKNYLLFSTTNVSFMGKEEVIGLGIFGNVFISNEVDKIFN